jgi:predicted Zn-dependent peptidase
MKIFKVRFLLISIILFYCTTSYAQKLKLDVKEHMLDNGLKILMLEKHDVPTVSLRIVYKVGSVNERPGVKGLSLRRRTNLLPGSKRKRPGAIVLIKER